MSESILQKNYLNKMHENLNRLSNGFVRYSRGSVAIDPVRIELSVMAGERAKGVIKVSSPDGDEITGTVISHNLRMHILTPDFSGVGSEIGFEFDASGMEPGEVIKGDIALLMDAGEFVVPYAISVLHGDIESPHGPVRNLFHFLNLAQEDFERATQIFYSDAFYGLMESGEKETLGLYRGFSAGAKTGANFESFLCAIKKKNPVSFRVSGPYFSDGVFSFAADEDTVEEIFVDMDGWGCCDFTVVSDAAFLVPEKASLSQADFSDRRAVIKVRIDSEKLHAGLNPGRIRFESPVSGFEAVFMVRKKKERGGVTAVIRRTQAFKAELIKLYIAYCIKNISRNEFEERCTAIADRLTQMDPGDVQAALFLAHAHIIRGTYDAGASPLPEVESCVLPLDQGYRYYLAYLLEEDGEKRNELCRKVSRLYMENPGSDRLLWLMLEMDEALKGDDNACINMIRHHFDGYGVGPLLLLKSYEMFSRNPALMESMGAFELQVLNFAVKTELYERGFVNSALAAASQLSGYVPLLYTLLTRLYERFNTNEILSAVCLQLMKGERTDEEAFSWYALGVEKNLGITRLIEYYIYALPFDHERELPKIVQYYFRYEAELPAKVRAALYAHIIKHCRGQRQLLGDYRPQMLEFAIRQARDGVISPDMTVIYRYLRSDPRMEDELKNRAETFAFSHYISCRRERPEYIVVVEEAFKTERRVKLDDIGVSVPVYSQNYEIFGEFEGGIRRTDLDFTDDNLMNPSDWEGTLASGEKIFVGTAVYFAQKLSHAAPLTGNIFPYVLALTESDQIRSIYKRPYMLKLLRYYGDDSSLEQNVLGDIDMSALDSGGRAEFLELLVHRGNLAQSRLVIERYGIGSVSPRLLMRLLSMSVEARESTDDPFVLWLCYECFKLGKYDEQVLRYLVLYLNDTTKTLRSLWRAATDFEIDTRALEERMLVQMMYTGAFVGEREDIFDSYERHMANPDVEMAWITQNANDYVILDSIMDERFFNRLIKARREGRELNDLCALSLILYFAENDGRNMRNPMFSDEVADMVTGYVRAFLGRKIVLKAFMAYRKLVGELAVYEGGVFVEHKCPPDSTVTVHYAITSANKPDASFRRLTMKSVIPGIFSARFMLFYGESLQYYMSEENSGRTSITESTLIDWEMPAVWRRKGRFDVMNEMLCRYEDGDRDTLPGLMEVYRMRLLATQELFKPI